MLDFNTWMGQSEPETATARAIDNARRIADKPIQITVRRAGQTLAPQTVRVELTLKGRDLKGDVGTVGTADVILFGYLNHPTIPNTDLKIGDRVYLPVFRTTVEVTAIDPTQDDRLMVYAKAVQT